MNLKRTNKLLALLLAVVMMVSLLPAAALADGGGTQEPSPIPINEGPFEVRLTADGAVVPAVKVNGWYSEDFDEYNITGDTYYKIVNPYETDAANPVIASPEPTHFALTEDYLFDASEWIEEMDDEQYDYYCFYLCNESLDDYVMVVLEVAKSATNEGPFEVRLTADGAVVPAVKVNGWYSEDFDEYKLNMTTVTWHQPMFQLTSLPSTADTAPVLSSCMYC